MKRMWRRKYLVIMAALAVFLSIGAAAWAADGSTVGESPSEGALQVVAAVTPTAAEQAVGLLEASGGLQERREALKEKREQWVERRKALLDLLREEMTPEDQAVYDRLVQTAAEQREALQKARQDLAATLKDLRALTDEYLPGTTGAGGVGTPQPGTQ